jgi:hypothetical protein
MRKLTKVESAAAGQLFEELQQQLLEQFGADGRHVFIVATMAIVAALFSTLADEARLAEALNAHLMGNTISYRLVPIT